MLSNAAFTWSKITVKKSNIMKYYYKITILYIIYFKIYLYFHAISAAITQVFSVTWSF